MTTTSTFTGLGEDAKPTSRVLKPPGGGSSNIFGGPEPAAAPKARATPGKKSDSGIFGGGSSDAGADGKRSARDGDDSFNRLFGDHASSPAPQQKGTSAASQRADTHSNLFGASDPAAGVKSSANHPDTYSNLFGDTPAQQPGAAASKQRGDTYSNIFGSSQPPAQNVDPSKGRQESTYDTLFGGAPQGQRDVVTPTHSNSRYSGKGRGAYNPITGADYKDLASNHHALHVKEQPKPQKEQPPLPCSDGEYQAKEGKMQNVQTSTRITNPPGGKTHKLW